MAGKPDYIVNQNGKYLPVELKTGKNNSPQTNHTLQLAAYCHLIEENYGVFVPYGILVYNNSNIYKISYNPKIRFDLESTIGKMKYMMKTGKIIRNHKDISRCKNCSMKKYCDERII